jgi:hypothetical protein
MTSISYLHGTSGETKASRFCREKARDCQRAALTTADPKIRLALLNLATLWREIADAESKKREQPKNKNVVIFFPKRPRPAKSEQVERS